MSDNKEITVEVGYQSVIIDKLFGSMVFANLRITANPETCSWVIERMGIDTGDWVEWVRIPGQFNSEFNKEF